MILKVGRAHGIWALAVILAGVPRAALAQDEPAEEEAPSEDAPAEEAPEEEAPVEEVVEEEVVEEGGGLALTQPPPAGKGAIAGIVTDTKFKEPVIEAYVGIVGTKTAVLTDVDGSFRLELPPGKYTLRIAYELHKPVRTSEVVVTAGKISRVDVKLTPEEGTEDVIETVVTLEQSSVEGLLLQRQKSAAAGDSIGRAEITKGNDRTAAEAAKRVVGANIEGSRFLFVRGLGERYTNALFDGFPLPSPEPDKQAVPLDLFPSQILESLTIVKTFTPDVPGDFAGGSVRINTRRVPNQLTIAGGLSMGFNTQTTFQDILTYDGGGLDWLGIDDGTRAMPDEVPDYRVGEFIEKTPDNELQTPEEVAALNRKMSSSQGIRTTMAAPNHAGNFIISNSWALGSDAKIGVLGAIVYDRRFERRDDEILREFGKDGVLNKDFLVDRGIDKVSWGLLAGLTVEVGKNHRFSLTGLQSQVADNETAIYSGGIDLPGGPAVVDVRKAFVSRSLTYGLFQAEHTIPEAGGMVVDYGLSLSRAAREEPDRRGVVFSFSRNEEGTKGYIFEPDGLSGQHFYADQGEVTVGGQLNVTQPVGDQTLEKKVKVGGAVSSRSRSFEARRFNQRPRTGQQYFCAVGSFDPSCIDKAYENLDSYELIEGTKYGDGYDGSLDVYAGYAMFDGYLAKQWRLVVGPRLEASEQSITPFDPVERNEEKELADRAEANKVEVLPAVALIYSPVPRVNLRGSLTRTLARPQMRELAPFLFSSFFGALPVRGNPELQNTSIVNADMRFEFFPKTTEVVAASAFYKRFENPIEQVVIATGGSKGTLSWQNALGANLFGLELEGRKSFDMFHPALRPLGIIANVTLSHSRVELDPATIGDVTNQSRALSYQAPYIVNLALDFDDQDIGLRARVSYNVVGERISVVGTSGIPDIYEQPRHTLDVTVGQRIGKHVEIRANASNLLDSPVRFTTGSDVEGEDSNSADSNVQREYFLGQTFSIGVGLNY
jgi:outer membrane receptor protein involved in Fe transport